MTPLLFVLALTAATPAPPAALDTALARAAGEAGQWQAAARLWRGRTRSAPNDGDAWAGLGLALARLGDDEAALAALDRAAVLGIERPGLATARGQALLRRGAAAEAVTAFDRALAADPHDLAGLVGLGVAWALLGQRDAALAAFDRALALDPLDMAARHNRARLLAAP